MISSISSIVVVIRGRKEKCERCDVIAHQHDPMITSIVIKTCGHLWLNICHEIPLTRSSKILIKNSVLIFVGLEDRGRGSRHLGICLLKTKYEHDLLFNDP